MGFHWRLFFRCHGRDYYRLREPRSPDVSRQGGAGSLRPDRDPHHPYHAELPGSVADATLYPGQQVQAVLDQAASQQGVEHGTDCDAGADHPVHPPSLRLQLLRGLDGPGGALLLLRYAQYYRIWRLYSSYVGEQPGYPWSGGRVPCGHLRVDSVRSGLLIASNKLHLQCIH